MPQETHFTHFLFTAHREQDAEDIDDIDDDDEAITIANTTAQLDSSITTTTTTASGTLGVLSTSVPPRSKSSDILKKDSPNDHGKTVASRLSHFNTLKQWGRNRFRSMQRSGSHEAPDKRHSSSNDTTRVSDADDDVNVYETVISKNKRKFLEKERKLSHERKPSYSSSEKSLACTLSQSSQSAVVAASINPVKLRESSAIRRQRRCGLGHKDEMNSSSGNWSASSESGRTSIGSELTVPPKSSASSTSLNHSHTMGSGPPSSIISRRRFLNTSASSSVTSEGTVTPDIQMPTDSYDDETSSAYSCDTEGYYTSFHIDSGLKTLKEEEPVTPLHTSSALSSTNSFGSTSNKTVLSADNEYELFGKGSTSTTASSAGTVCTTLMTGGSDRCLVMSPTVPERKSSLTKLNRSNSTNSNSTLERSCSSSTVGSTLERTGTIKRNGILQKKEANVTVHSAATKRVESPDSGNNTSSSPVETNSSSSPVHGLRSNSEFEYSESSDLEGVERVERIRVKTTINSSRIPSLCVITPSNSDDDDHLVAVRARHASPKRHDSDTEGNTNGQRTYRESEYAEITSFPERTATKPVVVAAELKKEYFKRASLLPLNTMIDRLKGVLPNLKPRHKDPAAGLSGGDDDPIYDNAGEYVTIADVANNNQMKRQQTSGYYYSNDLLKQNLATVVSANLNEETEYVSLNELPLMGRRNESNLLAVPNIKASAANPQREEKINSAAASASAKVGDDNSTQDDEEAAARGVTEGEASADDEGMLHHRRGARVMLDANGKVVYNSDSLKRRKGAHTTFAPGPCVKIVKDIPLVVASIASVGASSSSSQGDPILKRQITADIVNGVSHRKPSIVRPVISQSLHKPVAHFKATDGAVVVPHSSLANTINASECGPIASQTTSFQANIPVTTATANMLRSAYISSPALGSSPTPIQQSTHHTPQDLIANNITQGKHKSNLLRPAPHPIQPTSTTHSPPTKKRFSTISSTSSSSSSSKADDRTVKRSNSYRLANEPNHLSLPPPPPTDSHHPPPNLTSAPFLSPASLHIASKPQKIDTQHHQTSYAMPLSQSTSSPPPSSSSTTVVTQRRQQPQQQVVPPPPPTPKRGSSQKPSSIPSSPIRPSPPSRKHHHQRNSLSASSSLLKHRFKNHNHHHRAMTSPSTAAASSASGAVTSKSTPPTQVPLAMMRPTATTLMGSPLFHFKMRSASTSHHPDDDVVSIQSRSSSVMSKSFEQLMDQFSLSASFDDDDDDDELHNDRSYLKSESIENVESSSDFDSDTELVFRRGDDIPEARALSQQRRQQRMAAYVVLSPSKVTVPADGAMFRARVLSFGTAAQHGGMNGSTDIW